jgi:hypothetical protein
MKKSLFYIIIMSCCLVLFGCISADNVIKEINRVKGIVNSKPDGGAKTNALKEITNAQDRLDSAISRGVGNSPYMNISTKAFREIEAFLNSAMDIINSTSNEPQKAASTSPLNDQGPVLNALFEAQNHERQRTTTQIEAPGLL